MVILKAQGEQSTPVTTQMRRQPMAAVAGLERALVLAGALRRKRRQPTVLVTAMAASVSRLEYAIKARKYVEYLHCVNRLWRQILNIKQQFYLQKTSE